VRYKFAGAESDHIQQLQVKANVERELAVEPAALRLFGRPGLGHDIFLTDRRSHPLELTDVRTSSARLHAEADASWQKTNVGWTRKIHVQLAEGPDGKSDEVVQLFSSDPDYREMRIPVTVVQRSKQRCFASPEEVRLKAEPGRPADSFSVLIRDHDGQPVAIAKVEADDPALSCEFAEGARPIASVRISVNKDQTPAPASKLRVYIRQPAAQTLLIPVTGN
jgi:hypothetical protein